MRTLPFAKFTRVLPAGGGFLVATAESYEILVCNVDGELFRMIRMDQPNREVTPHDVQLYKEIEMAEAEPAYRQQLERFYREMPLPGQMPAYGRLVLDTEGNLWVGDYSEDYFEETVRYNIFDPAGHLLAGIETPQNLRLIEIGADYVLARLEDEMAIEYIQLYTLQKT